MEKTESGDRAPKPKHKVWKKQLQQPLPKWHRHQGSSNDCGPFSAMIVANGLRDTFVLDADAVARQMEGSPATRGTWAPLRLHGWATFPWGVAHVLRRHGFRARWRVGASLRDLYANLNRGHPTIVIVGEPLLRREGKFSGWSHYKTLYAWDPDEGFAFVDSAAADGVIYTYQTEAEFLKLWTNMGRQIIEVWEELG
jgi:hypothetical protein